MGEDNIPAQHDQKGCTSASDALCFQNQAWPTSLPSHFAGWGVKGVGGIADGGRPDAAGVVASTVLASGR